MPGRTIRLTWQEPRLQAPARYRRACGYDAYVPDPLRDLDLRLSAGVAGLAAEADAAVRALNERARPALAPLARLLLRTESIASSKVEGMQLDVRELARAEARMETGGRVSRDALEILATIDAMELAVDEAALPGRFAPARILAIHERLMERSQPARAAGRFRTVQNWIGGNDYNPCGADFVPPPPEHVTGLVDDLVAAIDEESLPPLIQAALVHAQFETIHPFDDGNGRTGRALIHVVLRRRRVAPAYVPPISVVLAARRERYIAALTKYRQDSIEEWLEHFLSAALGSARLASEYLAAVGELVGRWRDLVATSAGQLRADATAWALIEQLPAHPIVTAPVAAASTGRSKPQTYHAIRQLEDAGVLIPLSSGVRNRSWEAAGLLQLLAGLEAGESIRE